MDKIESADANQKSKRDCWSDKKRSWAVFMNSFAEVEVYEAISKAFKIEECL